MDESARGEERRRNRLVRVWREGVPLMAPAAEPARLYLAHRGLTGFDAASLKLHAGLAYFQEGHQVGIFPVLLALVQAPDGRAIALHRTYLTPQGLKAPVATPKKTMSPVVPGSLTGAAIRLGPVTGGRLALAEGVESAASFTRLTGWPCWSYLSASGLRAAVVPSEAVDVVIAADHDRNGVGQAAALALARRLLAEGRRTRIWAPPTVGTDWNDVLQEQERKGGLA
jgi:putative DNA primase/helicase